MVSPGPAEIILNFESQKHGESGDVRSLFDYADALRLVGRCKEALQVYELLENAELPKNRRAQVALFYGQTYLDMGLFAKAERTFRIAATLEPDTTVPWVYLAASLAHQERFEDAVATLRSALNLPGDQDEVLLNLGLNLRALGRLNEALDCLQKSLFLDPGCAEAIEAHDDVKRSLALQNGKEDGVS